ncbi:MAG: thioesterase family protein [Novosphingobium sp.]|nr:thioesterase family protein [Novosphingobium sp.]
MSFASLLVGAEPRDAGFALTIPEDWHQGRTAYGGLSAALALSAARRLEPEFPPLRSALVSFVGPLYGAVEARARVLRRGRNATWVSAEVLRGGEVGMTASFVFMRPAESAVLVEQLPPPRELTVPDDARPVPTERSPTFLGAHFEVRFAVPRSETARPEVCWWVRPKVREGLDPVLSAVLTADALPPGVLPLVPRGAPISSMTWQINLLSPAPETRDGWWLLRDVGEFAGHGGSSERMDLWNADGQPVIAGMQSVALFG